MKIALTAIPRLAIPRLAILFTLTLVTGLSSLSNAGEPDDLGSFDDILIALEPETLPFLEGPAINGPVVNGPRLDTIPQIQTGELILEGPSTTPRSVQYPQAMETQPRSAMTPGEFQNLGQVRNPFLDFETVVEAPARQQVETQYDLPSAGTVPGVVVPGEPQPRIVAPVPSAVAGPHNVDLLPNHGFTFPHKTAVPAQPRIVTKTIVVAAVNPECPYERALRLQRLQAELIGLSNGHRANHANYRTGYVPYGGLGLDRGYDRYRRNFYRSRSAIVPVYPGGYPTYGPRPPYGLGRGFSIGFGF